MKPKPAVVPDRYTGMLDEFSDYLLLQRERDPSTASSYVYDARTYLCYRLAMDDAELANLFTPEVFPGYVVYLRKRDLRNSTIQRRLIGAMRFWKFLYKRKLVKHPPVSLDDMDIVVKKVRNATQPLSPENFAIIRKEALNELHFIY